MNVYILNIDDITDEMITSVARQLPQRYAQSQKFKFEKGKRLSLGVGVLLLTVFPTIDESQIYANEHGKLFLKNGEQFNVSHSGKFVVLVKDENPVGIDIEEIKAQNLLVAEKVFTPEEREWMNDDENLRFYTLWTQKESLVKAVGCGITIPLESFSVLPFEQNKPVSLQNICWHNAIKQTGNYIVSVCATTPIASLIFVEVR